MKYIEKGKPPKSLTTYKSTPGANYDGCNKEDIRRALIAEQGAVCAYCMRRISEIWNEQLQKYKVEIEHFEAQNPKNTTSQKTLDYNNMLGVCNGNAGQPKKLLHCDKSKGNHQLSPLLNPLSKNIEQYITYSLNGRIKSDNEEIDDQLNQVLNLNMQNLINMRKAQLDTAFNRLNALNPKGDWKIGHLKKELKNWSERNTKNEFEPYCGIVIFFLKKWMQKAGKRQ